MSLIPVYRSRPSALHTARAGAGAAYCGALALTGALFLHPLVLSAALAAIVLAGIAAGVGREIGRSLRFALPFALLITLINPLVYPEGDTLLFRGGEVLGRRIDITLEATVAGALNGMRVIVIVSAFGLLSAAVDPDHLLRMFRRVSYRSALTATLATRLVPVLARDATRMGDAARCRPHPPGPARRGTSGALGRARPRGRRGGRPRGARLLARRAHSSPATAVVAARLARGRRGCSDCHGRRGWSDRRARLGGGRTRRFRSRPVRPSLR